LRVIALGFFDMENDMMQRHWMAAAAMALLAVPASALAQDASTRTRVILGPQLSPAVPGSSDLSFGPFIEVGRARGDQPFDFEAADESFGFPVVSAGAVEFGPALSVAGKRTPDKIGANLPNISATFEAGAFVQGYIAPALRLRAEARRGIGGHDGWIGELSADLVARDGDKWLVSAGPRVTINDARYQRAYFGVTPAGAAASGLRAYTPGGGVSAVGFAVGALRQFGPRWGVAAYARYDRLVGDAADSPIVRGPGSRNQPAAGIALSYVFGRTR
jgi:MipA family protein